MKATRTPSPGCPRTRSAAPEETLETQLWRLAAKDRDPNPHEAYLDRYPNGPHADDVCSREREGQGRRDPRNCDFTSLS